MTVGCKEGAQSLDNKQKYTAICVAVTGCV